MRVIWKSPSIGERRFITKFCWFPTSVGDSIIWLEKVTIEQEYSVISEGDESGCLTGWVNLHLVKYFKEN